MTMQPRRLSRIAIMPLAASALLVAGPARADEGDWATASDITRDVLVLTALGVPVAKGDKDGVLQAGGSMAITFGTTYALKSLIDEQRPDGSGNDSFPSGHTSISFAAAATLQKRYGWKVGLPAHLAAGFVGVARVKARKHRWGDVAAGAALGELTGLLITRKHDDGVQFFPWTGNGGGGVAMAMRF